MVRDVGTPIPQAAEFPLDLGLLVLNGAQVEPQLGQRVLLVRLRRGRGINCRRGRLPGVIELRDVADPVAAGRGQQLVEAVVPPAALVALVAQSSQVGLQRGDPITALPGDLQTERPFLRRAGVTLGLEGLSSRAQLPDLSVEAVELLVQQALLPLGKEERQRIPLCAEPADLAGQVTVRVQLGDQRVELLELGLRSEHRFVGLGRGRRSG